MFVKVFPCSFHEAGEKVLYQAVDRYFCGEHWLGESAFDRHVG